MAVQFINYDLQKPNKDYADLFEAIKSIGSTWWHCLGSAWIVKTDLTSAQVRDHLKPHHDANDKVVVTRLSGDWGTSGLDDNCNNWLRNNL